MGEGRIEDHIELEVDLRVNGVEKVQPRMPWHLHVKEEHVRLKVEQRQHGLSVVAEGVHFAKLRHLLEVVSKCSECCWFVVHNECGESVFLGHVALSVKKRISGVHLTICISNEQCKNTKVFSIRNLPLRPCVHKWQEGSMSGRKRCLGGCILLQMLFLQNAYKRHCPCFSVLLPICMAKRGQ